MYVESVNLNIGTLIDFQLQRVIIDFTSGHATASVILNGKDVKGVATLVEIAIKEVDLANFERKVTEALTIVFGVGARPNDRKR